MHQIVDTLETTDPCACIQQSTPLLETSRFHAQEIWTTIYVPHRLHSILYLISIHSITTQRNFSALPSTFLILTVPSVYPWHNTGPRKVLARRWRMDVRLIDRRSIEVWDFEISAHIISGVRQLKSYICEFNTD